MNALCLLILALGQAPADCPGLALLKSQVDTQRAGLQSVAFRFEGEMFMADEDPARKPPDLRLDSRFQGSAQYQSDGKANIVYYDQRTHGIQEIHRVQMVLRDGNYSEVTHSSERKLLFTPDQPIPGSAITLDQPLSPFRLYSVWLSQRLQMARLDDYECLGWETVGDRRCLKVALSLIGGQIRKVLWLDPERGMNILRSEQLKNGQLRARLVDVQLMEAKTPGGQVVWIPERGTFESFLRNGQIVPEPTARETYHILGESVTINPAIPDTAFVPASREDQILPDPDLPTSQDFDTRRRRF
jgi:hypothetical protein